jgi:hypothetical protein
MTDEAQQAVNAMKAAILDAVADGRPVNPHKLAAALEQHIDIVKTACGQLVSSGKIVQVGTDYRSASRPPEPIIQRAAKLRAAARKA